MIPKDRAIMEELAQASYQNYTAFKDHPKFLAYLVLMITLQYYEKTNIGCHPSKGSQIAGLELSDLRAIPFVRSWSQLKQNVLGFYGVSCARNHLKEKGQLDKVKQLYVNNTFFRTLVDTRHNRMEICLC